MGKQENLGSPRKKLGIKYPISAINPVEAFRGILLPAISNDQKWFDNGREAKELKLRPRELLGLIILSHVERKRTGLNWDIATDHSYGDGTVVVAEGDHKGSGIAVEQVSVTARNATGKTLADSVLKAIHEKESVSGDYPIDRSLLVFVNESGYMDIERVLNSTSKSPFMDVCIIGFLDPRIFHFYVGFKNRRGKFEEYEAIISKKTGTANVTLHNSAAR